MNWTRATTVTTDVVRARLAAAVGAIAPDVADELATIDADRDLFEELGLDSMDRISIMETLVADNGIDISEDMYTQLNSVDRIRDYLAAGTASR